MTFLDQIAIYTNGEWGAPVIKIIMILTVCHNDCYRKCMYIVHIEVDISIMPLSVVLMEPSSVLIFSLNKTGQAVRPVHVMLDVSGQ